MKITNTSRDQTVSITKADGSSVSIKPGETVEADVDQNNPQVAAQLQFGHLIEADKQPSSKS